MAYEPSDREKDVPEFRKVSLSRNDRVRSRNLPIRPLVAKSIEVG